MFENFKGGFSNRKWNDFLASLESRLQMRGGPGVLTKSTEYGYTVRNNVSSRARGSTSGCRFGQIVTTATGKGIRGGLLVAGDQNWNIEANEIDLLTDGEFLIWLEVGVTANNEDDLPLPGLETSDEPTWESGTVAGGYPDTVQPELSNSFIGTAIVPLGTLTVDTGAASFAPVACGNVTIGYCPINLSVIRS